MSRESIVRPSNPRHGAASAADAQIRFHCRRSTCEMTMTEASGRRLGRHSHAGIPREPARRNTSSRIVEVRHRALDEGAQIVVFS
jgi:hypothetical protein